MIKSITTTHPITTLQAMRHLKEADGFRFEDRGRCVLVWRRGAYVGRIPYEAIAIIEDEAPAPDGGKRK